jgi:hypothetical protein
MARRAVAGVDRTVERWTLALVVGGPLAFLLVIALVSLGTPTDVDGASVGFAQAYSPLFERESVVQREFDDIASTGAGWVRFDMIWSVIEADGPGEFDWRATDRAVAAASERDLQVLATLAYSPEWARAPGTPTDKYPPTDPADFAAYARAVAARYAPKGVHAYEIWNEPNTGFWSPAPDPVAYTRLLRLADAAIKEVDPGATVVSGGLARQGTALDWVAADGSGMSPWRFLREMYAAGAAGSFDVLGHHPYSQPGHPALDQPANTFQQTPALHELMRAQGEGDKEIWGTEAGAWTGTSEGAVSLAEQATLIVDSVTLWQRWSYTGPLFVYTLRDRADNPAEREDNFGLLEVDFTPKPAYGALRDLLSR